MPSPLRVLIADDSRVIRHVLADLLRTTDGLELVGEATNGVEAVDLAQAIRPEAIVLDLQMPRMSGLDALRTLRQRLPDTPVIVLTTHADAVYRRACLAAGAAHFLDKSFDLEGIGGVLQGVARARREDPSEGVVQTRTGL